ncbi:MAG: DUF2608 domain-containing protein [Xanthomonadales bacterium]|nr:DUF2608 domain-containing protein [Gammaproteobacteria bacterium]MBT8049871.1 DUF2608 domain-containing protein [Gammaproteobacteria bacterium]NNJ80401.1 DUF2608 domain-containing protein [Xanthomonadales bacterium]NNL05906.1 DUF2608 domain-containing protein [Xanthomonadales bacterium]
MPFLLLASALFLQACASAPPVKIPDRTEKTDDLTVVAETAIELAEQHGANNVLAVFDIDNTLLAMEQDLGADQWYYWQKALAEEDPCDPRLVSDRFAVMGALFYASAMRPTQPDAAALLRRVQDAGVPTIALTARGADYRLNTFRELRRNEMTFWPQAIPPARGWTEPFLPVPDGRPVFYEDGVYSVAGQHKGEMLKILMERTGYPEPAVIVMTDDKQDNTDAIHEAFGGSGTAVQTWHYTAEDEAVAAFDADDAATQWERLRPALKTIEALFGPDNFSLPEKVTPAECDGR